MDPGRVQVSLRQVSKIYRDILDDNSRHVVIPNAVESVEVTRREYEHARRNQTRRMPIEPWGYTIEHSQPLRFIPSKIRRLGLQVDVYCDIRWADDDMPIKQDIKVRIWSQHDETIFDPQRDSPRIEEELTNPARTYRGRVVSRFHFDKVSYDQGRSSEYHPDYHLQFGGIPEAYELCSHPKKVNVPRLSYHPMELFLICQMIAANFFWEEYLAIREKREWREELIFYQNLMLKWYYQRCLGAINDKESLLDHLCAS